MKSKFFGKKLITLSCLSSLVLLNSCAGMFKYRPYARNVKKRPGNSGVVALRLDHRNEDRDLAKSFMKENCEGKKVSVKDEGEVVIGTVTNSNSEASKGSSVKMGSLFGIPVSSSNPDSSSSSTTTTQKKEWQINYICS